MKDADKMTKLLEAANSLEDIIPSLPSRKRLSALLIEEALSIALNTTYQLVRQEENETVKNIKVLSNQIRSGVYDTSLDGEITKILSQMSQNDWKHPLLIPKCIKNSLNI